jgi:hypothetical protein
MQAKLFGFLRGATLEVLAQCAPLRGMRQQAGKQATCGHGVVDVAERSLHVLERFEMRIEGSGVIAGAE